MNMPNERCLELAIDHLMRWRIDHHYSDNEFCVAVCLKCNAAWTTHATFPRKHWRCGELVTIIEPSIWMPILKMLS